MAKVNLRLLGWILAVALLLPSAALAAPQRALVTTTVDDWSSTANFSWTSMVLDADGNPVIAYRYAPSSNLILAYCHDPLCSSASFRTLDSLSTVDAHISLKLSSAGNPVIAYYDDAGAPRLRLALCDDPICTTSTLRTLDTGVSGSYWVGRELSMVLDSNDIPVISYADSDGAPGLRLARCGDATCSSNSITTVSGTPFNPRETSLALDPSGNPMIVYHQNNGDLFFLHCDDSICTGSETLVTLYDPGGTIWAGRRLSMVLNSSGNPVISYSTRDSNSYQHIELIRCNNANCSSLSRQAVSTPGVTDYIRSLSLALNSAGNPVIAFADAADFPSGGTLNLAVCSTPTCNSTVDLTQLDSSVGYSSLGTSLQLDCEDNPVVSYHDDGGDALKLAGNNSSGCRPIYSGSPLPGSTIAFSGVAGSSQQADIDVSNTGPLGKLDVSFNSISASYTIVSGLDIDDLSPSDPDATITVQCDSVPQPDGTLVLNTTDSAQPIVVYDLTCEVAASSGGGSSSSSGSSAVDGGAAASEPIAPNGVTTLRLGSLLVSLPANAIPPGQTGCELSAAQPGSSAAYGFTLDDAVFDVKVNCDSGELNVFLAPLTICIQPPDGVAGNKLVYHSHNGGAFTAMNSAVTQPGYVCGQTQVLSLFTLGQLALPNTGFAPGRVGELAEQTAEYAYAATDLSLSIPKLGVELSILGVPQGPNGWDVSWLQADQAGYLYGTSFPTWAGNSALTAHVWNADNTPGPFYALKELQFGDRFSVSAYGYTYIYEVRSNRLMSPGSLAALSESSYNLITLITCESFDDGSGQYRHRRAVQAVLVEVY